MARETGVGVVASGDFGWAVAGAVRALLTRTSRPVRIAREPMALPSGCFIEGGFGIRAAWRDVHSEFESFASAARSVRVPWLPVALDHPYVRIGPAVIPDGAPCHLCYLARVRQHGSPLDAEIQQAQDADAQLGVRGFPPHLAMLAAGLALPMMHAAEAGRGGMLVTINSHTDEVSTWRVVPCHDCPGCAGR
jgi:hypothetical protein